MKIRNPLLFKIGCWAATIFIRAWLATLRAKVFSEQADPNPYRAKRGFIICVWHENLLTTSYLFANRQMNVIVSESADGEIISGILEHLNYRPIRGSTTRGAVRAVRELARSSEHANLAITPDGPRGPRRELQDGVVYLASRTGLAILPVGHAYDRPWRAKSWDRLVIPKPFRRAAMYLATPIAVPADADSAVLAEYKRRTVAALDWAEQQAEQMIAQPGVTKLWRGEQQATAQSASAENRAA